jgi:glycosyltransferase involved in cell wall biosynthesis
MARPLQYVVARLAVFSPMPPARSGVAACSADLLPALREHHHVDLFVDAPLVSEAGGFLSAHDFPWRHRLAPYDLTIYQLGNSSCHDYLWPYLFRFPGLTILHDARLHHARAAALLRRGRADQYREEFVANQPGIDRDLAELAVAGYDSALLYSWPMTRLAVQASRLVGVHTRAAAAELERDRPDARVQVLRLGHGVALPEEEKQRARARARTRFSIPQEAPVFGCFGGLTPEKRLSQILDAFTGTLAYAPGARLLLAGDASAGFDLRAQILGRGLAARTVVTGYLESDAVLTDCIAACDVSLNLRWPTAGEISGPWLRCLALGLPTVIVDLAHLADVPSLDPRTWQPHGGAAAEAPVCVAIDILDEDHSLGLAMRRLATQPALRQSLGRAAAAYWRREHAPDLMAGDYRRLVSRALREDVPRPALPGHLLDDGARVLEQVSAQFGLPQVLS